NSMAFGLTPGSWGSTLAQTNLSANCWIFSWESTRLSKLTQAGHHGPPKTRNRGFCSALAFATAASQSFSQARVAPGGLNITLTTAIMPTKTRDTATFFKGLMQASIPLCG